jgi:predicted Zn-dependent protease with MMP-like domain
MLGNTTEVLGKLETQKLETRYLEDTGNKPPRIS